MRRPESSVERAQITQILHQAANGDASAAEALVEAVYDELERVAGSQVRRAYGGQLAGVTLEPAVLVNETLLKLIQNPRDFENRRHFYAYATTVMMRVLVDYQRARGANKRGGDRIRVTLSGLSGERPAATEATDLARALEKLESLDARKAEVVRLRFFWGLQMTEIAELLGTSLATVNRDWKFARHWLSTELREREAHAQ